MPGRLIQMGVTVEDLQVTVTAFRVQAAEGQAGEEGSLRFNFYCAKIKENVDVLLSVAEQIDIIGEQPSRP
jgi:phosphatidylglycerophosphatase A